jgi:DNA-binding NtrC family response regulator
MDACRGSHSRLKQQSAGKFREDLYFRLAVVIINLRPFESEAKTWYCLGNSFCKGLRW